ncbi:sigma-54-dependent Fis family transcriptional regulator [Yoonia sp.]|uniref:sigma-54-dependent Fis family transcriptional regulator n=1 Tax=Yoonia sp. TaxID=2212373 RepID=UPI003A4DB196
MSFAEHSLQPPQPGVLQRARALLERGSVDGLSRVNKNVAQSWKRCLDAHLNPLDRPENLVVDRATLGSILDRHGILRKLARPELDLLFGQVSGSNYLLALGSPEGVVMDVLADESFKQTDAGRAIIEGSIWEESVRGTNAMGLALHDKESRTVWQGEHFFRSQGRVSCIAVPIFDSNGEIAGILDASTGSEDWHSHSVALLNMSAANIEAGLFLFEQGANTILRVHSRSEYLPTVSAGLIALNNDGRIVSISRRARNILGIETDRRALGMGDLFCEPEDIVLGLASALGVFRCRSRINGTVFLSCSQYRIKQAYLDAPLGTVRPRRAEYKRAQALTGPVFSDPKLRRQIWALDRMVNSKVPILIRGENGVGKSTLAQYIHQQNGPKAQFVAINCAGVFDDVSLSKLLRMLERALEFDRRQSSRNTVCRTLFLEGVDELPENAQGALLRILDAYENIAPNTLAELQIVASICDTAQTEVHSQSIRPDLFYRLGAFSVHLPPLRQRSDLPEIASALMSEVAPGKTLDADAHNALASHDWPGNIRELRSVLTIAAAMIDGEVVEGKDVLATLYAAEFGQGERIVLPERTPEPCDCCRNSALRRDRCVNIRQTYLTQGMNASLTARKLGIARSTLYQHIRGLQG